MFCKYRNLDPEIQAKKIEKLENTTKALWKELNFLRKELEKIVTH